MAEQMRRAIAWVWRNACELWRRSEPACTYRRPVILGAHLAAVALTTDWPREFWMCRPTSSRAGCAPAACTS